MELRFAGPPPSRTKESMPSVSRNCTRAVLQLFSQLFAHGSHGTIMARLQIAHRRCDSALAVSTERWQRIGLETRGSTSILDLYVSCSEVESSIVAGPLYCFANQCKCRTSKAPLLFALTVRSALVSYIPTDHPPSHLLSL